jgi:glycogen debranching enzyme
LIDIYLLQGRHEEARREAKSFFERLLSIRNHVGLLSEEFDVKHGLVGNFRQAFSHTRRESKRTANSGKNTLAKLSTFRPKGARGRPTNIANAVVIKDADIFVLCQYDAGFPLDDNEGFGLYYHDCRFLKGYEVWIGKSRLNALASSATHGYKAEFELTNRDLGSSAKCRIKKQSVGFNWQRIVEGSKLSVHDVITCTNYTIEPVAFVLTFVFEAGFEDIFEIRGANPSKIGTKRTPKWHRDTLVFSYDGADGLRRTVAISISPHTVKVRRRNGADVAVRLEAKQSKEIKVSIRIREASKNKSTSTSPIPSLDAKALSKGLQQNSDDWLRDHCQLQSDSNTLNILFERSIRDLGALRTILHGKEYFSAGLPWYGALFGRDSILSSLQTLAFRPAIAEQTLRLMAKYQGKEVNDWRDEQPGKIMHELRVGEMAHLNEIPQTPYYGSVDSTPLFLILVAHHANWTGDLSLFRELEPSIDHALDWITRYGDETGDGYLQYRCRATSISRKFRWRKSMNAMAITAPRNACAPKPASCKLVSNAISGWQVRIFMHWPCNATRGRQPWFPQMRARRFGPASPVWIGRGKR